jgi:hypothetical protein
MLSTKDIISIDEVPETWIFEYYAGLTQNLLGEDVTIKSLFKPNEKTPSMKIFNKDGRYFYKDFSSDNGGTAFGLVQKLYGLNYGETVSKILDDYKSHSKYKSYTKGIFKTKQKTLIDNYTIKPWTNRDVKFWSKYNIGSNLLERYNIKPCDIVLKKGDNIIDLTGKMIYAYFDSNNEIYKIYQPYNKENKFLTFKEHVQGIDQLEYKHDYLLIVSSMKDGLALESLRFPVEFIAPSSENTIIKKEVINSLKTKYKKIGVILDNDDAGFRNMLKYNSLYNFEYANLDMSKDISDSIKDFGVEHSRREICKLLKDLFL